MDSKIAKTQTVLIKLDCKSNTRSFSRSVNVTMDRVDGMYVSQVVCSSPIEENAVFAINTDLITDGYIALVTDGRTTSPNTYFKMSGSTVNGNYTFRIDDVADAAVETDIVIGLLLTFVKFT